MLIHRAFLIFTLEHIVVKPSSSSSRRVMIEKDGSIYKLRFSMRLWGEDKRLERRRGAICYIPKSHLLPESSCFSDICPRWLAKQSRAVDQLMQSSLRKSIGISLWLQSSLKIALGYLSSAIPSEGKPLRPDGGALESEEMGPFIMKLLLFSHLWHFYTWNPRLWLSQIKSYLSGRDK